MSILTPQAAAEDREAVEYPESDGQPLAETSVHVQAILLLFQALLDALPEPAFVAADLFWYWEEGHPESRVAPDLMVVRGGGRVPRRSFFTWREGGAVPVAVFEMASQGTWREDLGEKRRLYERLGVREYVLFDPEGEYLRPPLMGFRLVEGCYALIVPDADDRLWSEELGLWLRAEGSMLRLFDGTTGAPVPTRQERAEQAQRQAEQAEQQAEQARQQAEQARQQAEQAQRQADALAAEVERLKALLGQAPGGAGGGLPPG